MKKSIYFITAAILILLVLSCGKKKENIIKKSAFILKLETIKNNKTAFLPVDSIGKIKTKQLYPDSDMGSHDLYNHERNEGFIYNELFDKITATEILKITDTYVLFLLKSKFDPITRVATIDNQGNPIESILLQNNFGNNEFNISRIFSFPDNYNSDLNELIFEDIRYDTEWITFPTDGKKVLTSKQRSTIGIRENGTFYVKSQQEISK